MRLAILPITSFRHLKGESEVVMFTAMVKQWVQTHDDCWIYMVLPEDCAEQGWEGAAWPHCSVIWSDRLGLYYDKLAEIPANFMTLFNQRNGQFQLDGIITSRRATAVGFARETWDHRLKETIPVFIDESHSVDWGRTSATVSDIEIVAQTLGCAIGWPVWDTEVEKEKALNAARHWLAGKRTLEIMEKGVVIPCGFDPSRIDRIVEPNLGAKYAQAMGVWKEPRFTLFFGGRLNRGAKRADVLLREYDAFFRFGRDVDVTVCSPKDEGWILDMIKREYPEINVLVQTPSDEFVQRASRAHVFMNTSKQEGFSVGFTEMMYMTKYGTILLAPREPWVRGLFGPKFDEYPFLYEDFEQARVMLRWIHENYDEAVGQVQEVDVASFVADEYDSQTTYEEHWQHYRHVTQEVLTPKLIRGLMSESNRELAMETLSVMPERFDIDAFYREMIARSRAMKEDPRRGQTTKWALRLWMMHEKLAMDTYDTPVVTMSKLG